MFQTTNLGVQIANLKSKRDQLRKDLSSTNGLIEQLTINKFMIDNNLNIGMQVMCQHGVCHVNSFKMEEEEVIVNVLTSNRNILPVKKEEIMRDKI